ncbi:MAG: PEP-CTERM sorting domain-containing protein [Candidatus Nealsonbacteria bacterium]|nr:PEP-CTERM sorting domain-containing protein [Candidatus Nealsonbacteria bacterium]
MRYTSSLVLFLAAVSFFCSYTRADEPVKVFILAGQSNMEGKGRPETGYGGATGAVGSLRYQVNNDPANYGHLVDAGANWVARDDVWIWSTTDGGEKGNLTVGFGSNDWIGPELGFGSVVGDFYDEQVLLIKTAWGGKSLAVDFRPPSSGAPGVGVDYNNILSNVNYVLDNLAAEFSGYNGQGYELVGLGWHQGWNDRVNQGFNDEYEANLANFIRDIRDDLGVAQLPFVLAETGMSGYSETHHRALSLMAAQAAVADAAKYPEFAGNVAFVETKGFFRDSSQSPNGQAYHWNSNAETYYLIGDGMGEAMMTIVPEPSSMTMAMVALVLSSLALAFRRRRSFAGSPGSSR